MNGNGFGSSRGSVIDSNRGSVIVFGFWLLALWFGILLVGEIGKFVFL